MALRVAMAPAGLAGRWKPHEDRRPASCSEAVDLNAALADSVAIWASMMAMFWFASFSSTTLCPVPTPPLRLSWNRP